MERDEIEDGSGTESLLDRREHGKISNGPVAAAEGRATPILILSIFAVTCSSFDFGWVVSWFALCLIKSYRTQKSKQGVNKWLMKQGETEKMTTWISELDKNLWFQRHWWRVSSKKFHISGWVFIAYGVRNQERFGSYCSRGNSHFLLTLNWFV